MNLNPYCIKDILITLEYVLEPDEFGRVESIQAEKLLELKPLDNYPTNVALYHIHQMFDHQLIKKGKMYINSKVPQISDITPQGHLLLKELKNKKSFEKFAKLLTESGQVLALILPLFSKL